MKNNLSKIEYSLKLKIVSKFLNFLLPINSLLLTTLLILLFSCKVSNPVNIVAPIELEENYVRKASVDGIRIAWDFSTLKKIAPSNAVASYNGYVRLIELKDGSLLCVYESSGNIEATKSSDKGTTWQVPIRVASAENGINMAVPDILELNDGSLLISYNPRPTGNNTDINKRFAIKIKISTNGGQTWNHEKTIYEAGHQFQNGCWEPSQIQLPNGEIQLFFANEGIYTSSDEQNISMLKSSDGGFTWSTSPEILSFRAGRRDGMPSPIILKNNEIVYAIEDNDGVTFKPFIIRTTMEENWKNAPIFGNSAYRNYALLEKLHENIYAGAPYLRQLKTGETILSYQSTENRANNSLENSRMIVAIGSENARDFNRTSEPFIIPAGKSGLWNSVSVLKDNTVIALTSTNGFAKSGTEVWMIKGHIIPEITVKKQTVILDGNLEKMAWSDTFPIFVGQKGQAQLNGNILYNDDFLYFAANVKDNTIKTESNTISDNDGVSFSVDGKNKSSENLTQSIFKISISADGRIKLEEGSNGSWKDKTNKFKGIVKAIKKSSLGYTAEMAIPWTILGGKPNLNNRIGFDIGLINNDGNNSNYKENITSNVENKPFTWSKLALK